MEFEILVKYKNLAEGTHIHCHLKKNTHKDLADASYLKSTVVNGTGEHTFKGRLNINQWNSAKGDIYALIFCTKDGNWKTNFNHSSTNLMQFCNNQGEVSKADQQ